MLDELTPVPTHVADAVRRTARSMPLYPVDVRSVLRRGAVHRRQRAGTVLVAVAVTGLVALGTPSLVRAARGGPAGESPGQPALNTAGPQRLILPAVDIEGVRPWCGVSEVATDGSLLFPKLPASDTVQPCGVTASGGTTTVSGSSVQSAGLADGRLVLQVIPTARNAVPGGPFYDLQVVRPNGSLAATIHLPGGDQFVGADERQAYVLHGGSQIVGYDLRTGRSHGLFTVPGKQDNPKAVERGYNVDVAAGRLAMVTNMRCEVHVFDIDGGNTVASVPLSDVTGCVDQSAVRLSPDGRLLAMEYVSTKYNLVPRVLVLDLTTRAAVLDVPLPQGGLQPPLEQTTVALAWLDNGSVRVAWTQLPTGASGTSGRLYDLKDALRLYTMKVPG
jgi:hypothetical protein